MKTFKKSIIFLIFLNLLSIAFLLGTTANYGQVISGSVNTAPPPTPQGQVQDGFDSTGRLMSNNDPHRSPDMPNSTLRIGNLSKEKKLAAIKAQEKEILNDETEALNPSGEYYEKYAAVLKDTTAGLARVYPDKNCFKNERTISVEQAQKCVDLLPIMGDGSYYSFRLKSNLNQKRVRSDLPVKADRADIHYINGKIEVGSFNVQGIIAEVADANFEALNKDSAEVKFLKDYKPKDKLQKIEAQKKLLQQGIKANGLIYTDSVAAKVGSTYVVRSIAYQFYFSRRLLTGSDQTLFESFIDFLDYRTDITVAFKVVGQEPDGSLVILWKELNKKNAPYLKG